MNILKQTYAVVAIVAMMLCPQSVWADCAPNAHAYTYGKQSDGSYLVQCKTCGATIDQSRTILYTSVENEVIEPYRSNFGATFQYSCNVDGKGVMVFDGNVTAIPNNAFFELSEDYTPFIQVVLPNTVKTIGEYAFFGCSYLQTIELGNSVETINKGALESCIALSNVELPKSIKEIGVNAFAGNHSSSFSLKLHSLPNVGSDAFNFANWSSKVSVELFDDSYIYTGKLIISYPEIISAKYTHTISASDQWGSAIVPFNVTSTNQVKIYTVETLFDDGGVAMMMMKEVNGTNVVEANHPFFFKKVNPSAISVEFTLASENVVAPNNKSTFISSITTGFDLVGTYASANITNTTEKTYFIQQSESVQSINSTTQINPFSVWMEKTTSGIVNEYALSDNYSVIYCETTDDNDLAFTGSATADFKDNDDNSLSPINYQIEGKRCLIFKAPVVKIGEKAFYNIKNLKSIEIPSTVTSIGDYTFAYCSNMSSIDLTKASSLETIGNSVFVECNGLLSATIPANVKTVGQNCFNRCKNLASVIFEEGNQLTKIPSYMFGSCEALTAIDLPNTVTTIFGFAFSGSGITSIVLPNSVATIDQKAFESCKSLTSVTLSNKLEYIGEYAFSGSGLTSITIPRSLKNLKSYAFRNCTSLKTCTFEGNIKVSLGTNVFEGCTSLEKTNFPENLTSIPSYTFYKCSALKEVELHDGITSFGYGVFRECSSLKSIVLPNQLTQIGSQSFYKTRLESIDIPASVEHIIGSAFYECEHLVDVQFNSYPKLDNFVFYGCNSAQINVNLTDASYLSIDSPGWDGITTETTASYSRSMTSEWGTAILPFEVSSDENVQCYQLSKVNGDGLTFSPVKTVAANTPFVFQKLDSEATTAVLSGTKVASISSSEYEAATDVTNWYMYGTYAEKENQTGIIFISHDQFWTANSPVTIKKFRGWLGMNILSTPVGFSASSFRIIVETAENETAILEIDEDGSLQDATQGIYDLGGHKLDAPVKGQINIINGKKVFIK